MSRISFNNFLGNKEVQVVAGWDNPLRMFWLDVINLNDDEDIIYSSIYENDPQDYDGISRLEDVLNNLGIVAPQGFWNLVLKREGNVETFLS
jgi:hypothetical protein